MASPNKVDEEYMNALQTKSYTDLYAQMHDPLLPRTASTATLAAADDDYIESESHKLHHSHSSPIPYRHGIPEFLLEPSQEYVLEAVDSTIGRSGSHFHGHINALLLDFFDATLQACIACSCLLSSIDRARSHHRSIRRRLLMLTLSSSDSPYAQLSSDLALDNPLSLQSLSHFHRVHARYPALIRELTAAHRRIVRRRKIVRFARTACGVAVLGAIAIVAIATHAAVAIAAVPAAAAAAGRRARGCLGGRGGRRERARARMEVAAKGAYIVGRDMDTVSRMVRRAHDEVEHGREVGRMVVRNKGWEMAREVVKEMGEVGTGMEEQLRELEEHVYLCLIAINRSRRLVAQE